MGERLQVRVLSDDMAIVLLGKPMLKAVIRMYFLFLFFFPGGCCAMGLITSDGAHQSCRPFFFLDLTQQKAF